MTEIQTPETSAAETNAVPYFPYQAPTPVPLTKRRWFLPVALAAAVLVGAGGASAVASSAAAVKTANCKEAFKHADTAFDAASNTIGYLTYGLGYAARLDATSLGEIAPKIQTETDRLKEVKDDFKASRALCEG